MWQLTLAFAPSAALNEDSKKQFILECLVLYLTRSQMCGSLFFSHDSQLYKDDNCNTVVFSASYLILDDCYLFWQAEQQLVEILMYCTSGYTVTYIAQSFGTVPILYHSDSGLDPAC